MGKNDSSLELKMKCFGNFELTYGKKSLLKGKNKESQIITLLQFLLHAGKDGVTRERLEEVLFEQRNVENKHHALQSVIYNTKRKLEAIGLPQINYILHTEGIFYWNEAIVVIEDAKEFEKMYEAAVKEVNEERKLDYYMKACYLYKDEFLPGYRIYLWVDAEARRYQKMFYDCVNSYIELLEKRNAYSLIVEIGMYAAEKIPYEKYEENVIDGFIKMGNKKKALEYYKEVENKYIDSQEVGFSSECEDYINKLAWKISDGHGVLNIDQIQEDFSKGLENKAFYCTFPIFRCVYQLLVASSGRWNSHGCLMMCSIVDYKGEIIEKEKVKSDVCENFKNIICNEIRKGDVVTKYSYGQYMVLLNNTELKYCDIVKQRIKKKFEQTTSNYKVNYDYINIY